MNAKVIKKDAQFSMNCVSVNVDYMKMFEENVYNSKRKWNFDVRG